MAKNRNPKPEETPNPQPETTEQPKVEVNGTETSKPRKKRKSMIDYMARKGYKVTEERDGRNRTKYSHQLDGVPSDYDFAVHMPLVPADFVERDRELHHARFEVALWEHRRQRAETQKASTEKTVTRLETFKDSETRQNYIKATKEAGALRGQVAKLLAEGHADSVKELLSEMHEEIAELISSATATATDDTDN